MACLHGIKRQTAHGIDRQTAHAEVQHAAHHPQLLFTAASQCCPVLHTGAGLCPVPRSGWLSQTWLCCSSSPASSEGWRKTRSSRALALLKHQLYLLWGIARDDGHGYFLLPQYIFSNTAKLVVQDAAGGGRTLRDSQHLHGVRLRMNRNW